MAIVVLAALPAAAAGAAVPSPPPNLGCDQVAVVAKLSVTEDRAAANMLAEAARLLGLGGRCLVDAGDPDADELPPGSRGELAGVPRVFVVGGPAAIPDEWLTHRLGVGPYTRVSGADRWATQSAVARAIVKLSEDPTTDPSPVPTASHLNTDCSGSAVLAKLTVVEDQAAANMLAEALRWLDPDGAKCLLDVGDPGNRIVPSASARSSYASTTERYVVGGTTAIPADWLSAHFGRLDVKRVAGADRWATQAAVAVQIIEIAHGKFGTYDVVFETPSSEGVIAQEQSSVSDTTVDVFYCAPAGSFDGERLVAEVKRIDDAVGRFYRVQFGDSDFSLAFNAASVLSPDLTWADHSITGWRWNEAMRGCHDALTAEVKSSDGQFTQRRALLIADVQTGGSIAGFARTPSGPAVVAARSSYPTHGKFSQANYYYAAIAHELGHLIYGFSHPHPDDDTCGSGSISAEELRSIMSWPTCGGHQDITGLTAYVSCSQRESKGWVPTGSCEGNGPPPDRPAVTELTPGDGSLTLRWNEPNGHRQAVTGYDVRYRQAGDSHDWRDWRPDRAFTGQSATITGLANGVAYEVGVRAKSRAGDGQYSPPVRETPQPGTAPRVTVTLSVGGDAQGTVGSSGSCLGVHCRWLHVEVEGLGPGPHTLACAHNGAGGYRAGVYRSATVTSWPNETSCVFGFPGAEVFVIVGAEHRDGVWYGGHYSNVVTWPDCNQQPARCPGRTATPRLRASDGSIAVRLGATIAYDIQYRQAGASTWNNWHAREYVDIAGDGKWTTIDGLTNGATYEIRIRSRGSTINHDWSRSVSATPTSGVGLQPTLTVRRGDVAVDDGDCPAGAGCRWVIGSGTGWPAGEQFWIKCGGSVDTSQNIPVPYRDRFVDATGNLSWDQSICYSATSHTVEVWTQSGARKSVLVL